MYFYRAFGQTIQSQLELPEFETIRDKDPRPDVQIICQSLPPLKPEDRNAGMFQVRDGIIAFEVEDVLRLRVAEADKIQIEILDPDKETEARLYLTGSGFGAWSFFSGKIPFHCGLVAQRGMGFAITGPSGVGKSTLTTALVKNGFGFMSDDVVILSPAGASETRITPSFPRIKLWADAAHHFAIETRDLKPIHGRMDKFHVPFPPEQIVEQAKLGAVYLLKEIDAGDEPSFARLSDSRALRVLRENIYRPDLIDALGLESTAFRLLSNIAKTVPVFEIARPKDFSLFAEQVQTISDSIESIAPQY